MQLSLHTDYSLRILMTLAATGRQMSVDEIARTYGISRNHLAKVAHRLQTFGYVATARGRNGGLRLAMPPASVNVGEVVRKLENLEGFVDCLSGSGPTCPAAGICGLQGALRAALGDFLKRLDGYTLSDLVPDRQRFANHLLAGHPPPRVQRVGAEFE